MSKLNELLDKQEVLNKEYREIVEKGQEILDQMHEVSKAIEEETDRVINSVRNPTAEDV